MAPDGLSHRGRTLGAVSGRLDFDWRPQSVLRILGNGYSLLFLRRPPLSLPLPFHVCGVWGLGDLAVWALTFCSGVREWQEHRRVVRIDS